MSDGFLILELFLAETKKKNHHYQSVCNSPIVNNSENRNKKQSTYSVTHELLDVCLGNSVVFTFKFN